MTSNKQDTINYGRYSIKTIQAGGGWQARAFRGMKSAGPVQAADTRDAATLAVKAYLDETGASERASRGADGYPASATIRDAIDRIRMTDGQRNMLNAHLDAPDHVLTATQLSQAAPYRDYHAANMHYGLLGRMLAEEMDWEPRKRKDGTPVWTYALANDADDESNSAVGQSEGEFRWRLRSEVAEALRI